MIEVLEAVPNFSEGRDLAKVRALVDTIAAHGVEILDWSADPDHNRSVVTYIGGRPEVEAASIAAASFAVEHIDLTRHRGVHPRIGALDVLPFVPLAGLEMADAVASAHRVGAAIARLGVPVFFYAQASRPPGRALSAIRKGGFEGVRDGFDRERCPDLPEGCRHPHPTAGATCVGARKVLLAWNVFVAGIDLAAAREIASTIRERNGGFAGVRALGLWLERRNRLQVSMNLEDLDRTSPVAVYDAVEAEVVSRGGHLEGTEVIGMIPDALVLPGVADRLQLLDPGSARVLSHRVAEHVKARAVGQTESSDRTG